MYAQVVKLRPKRPSSLRDLPWLIYTAPEWLRETSDTLELNKETRKDLSGLRTEGFDLDVYAVSFPF
jgi:hypothetical protein